MHDPELEYRGFYKIIDFKQVEEFETHLEEFLNSSASILWEDGQQILGIGKALVGQVSGLRIEIRPREHAPPHFHVIGPGINASFSISNGEHLAGNLDSRQINKIQFWYEFSKHKLIQVWNETRPYKCPVGPFIEP